MPQRQKLNPDQISPSEIERLLSISSAAQDFLRHDLNGLLTRIQYSCMRIDEILEENETTREILGIRDLSHEIDSASRALYSSLRHLRLGSPQNPWGFTACLPEIAKRIITELHGQDVSLLASSEPELRVLFPGNALYGIIYELARNASVHAAESPIALDWSLEGDVLLVSVHDGGTTLSHLLTDRLLPLELIEPQLFKVGDGLSIVRDVARFSGGLLLARRSKVLGGAEIAVRLPIGAYSLGEPHDRQTG